MQLHKFTFQRKMSLISLSCCRRDSVSLPLYYCIRYPAGQQRLFVTSLLFLVCTLQRKGLLSGFVPLVLVAPTSSLARAHLHTAGLLFPSQQLVTCLLYCLCREGQSPFAIQPSVFCLVYWWRDRDEWAIIHFRDRDLVSESPWLHTIPD